MQKISNVIAERAVLAGICQYGSEAYLDIVDILGVKSFTIDSNQIIFKCLKHILDNNEQTKIDMPTILASSRELKLDNILLKKEEMQHLNAIMALRVDFTNIRKLAAKIRKLEIARLLKEQLNIAQNKMDDITGDESGMEIISIAENTVLDFSSLINDNSELPKKIGENIDEYIDYLENNIVDQMGISSGFPIYDSAIGGGFRKGTVNIISSRMKIGKTTLGINMGYNVAKKLNIPVLFLDTEMMFNDTIHKILGLISGVPINEIETGRFNKNQAKKTKVKIAAKTLKEIPYYHKNISGKEFEEILSIMRRFITKDVGVLPNGEAKSCLIIYDYIKLMDSKGINEGLKEFQLLGFLLTSLHNFSVRYKVPILSFAQQNREGLDKNDTGTIAGSDRILMYASNCCLFKIKTEEEIAEDGIENGNRKIIPLICRHGSGLPYGDYINVELNGSCGSVKEISSKLQLYQNGQSSKNSGGFVIDEKPNPNYNELRESFAKTEAEEIID